MHIKQEQIHGPPRVRPLQVNRAVYAGNTGPALDFTQEKT